MRFRPHWPSTCLALGLLLCVFTIAVLSYFPWKAARLEETRRRLNQTAGNMVEAVNLRWGATISPQETQKAEAPLAKALSLTPGILGIFIVAHQDGQAILLAGVGDLPDQMPTQPDYLAPVPPLVTPDGFWLASAPVSPETGSNGTYLWVLADPKPFQPDGTADVRWAAVILMTSIGLVAFWWLLRSLTGPLPPLLRQAQSHAETILITGAILIATVSAAALLNRNAERQHLTTFIEIAAPIERRIIESVLDVSTVGTESLAAFFKASDEVDAQEFAAFSHHLTPYPGVEAWFWLTPVTEQTLAQKLARIRSRDHHPGLQPWRLDHETPPGPGAVPEGALLVEFVEPRDQYLPILGFVFESDKAWAEFAARALARNAPTAGLFPRLAHRPEGPPRLIILHPAVLPDGALLGCAGAVVRPDHILHNAVSRDSRVRIDWLEADADGNLSRLATSATQPEDGSRTPPVFTRTFFAFGNTYLLRTAAGPSFPTRPDQSAPLIVFISGTLLAFGAWRVSSDETRFRHHLQQIVAERTAELEATQARYADLARRNRTFVWEVDANGLYQFLDPVVELVLGYRPEELVGKVHLWELHPAEGKEQLREDVFRHFREKTSVTNYENRAIAKDGRVVWLSSSGGPLLDANDTFIGYRGWDTDISREKERDLLAARAQRLESLGILAGGIAHDLNNALGPILMSADLLRLDENDPDKKQLLRTILDSARRGSDMVRQVLLFARGSEGQKIPLDPRTLLSEIVPLIRDTFPKNITIDLHSRADPPPFILANSTQLYQVLLNLCINARDAMPSGGNLRLSLLTQPPPVPGQRTEIHLVIEDTGQGMTPEVQARAFDPFFTTKDVGRGTGLGLSTSHTIIQDHGGRILLDSTPGKGTRFTLILPALPTPTVNSAHHDTSSG